VVRVMTTSSGVNNLKIVDKKIASLWRQPGKTKCKNVMVGTGTMSVKL